MKAIEGDGFVTSVAQCQYYTAPWCTMTHEETHEHKTWVSTTMFIVEKIQKKHQNITFFLLSSPHFPISPTFSPPTGEEEGEEVEKRRKVEMEEEEERERERSRRKEEKREIEEELAQTLEKARPHPPAPTSRYKKKGKFLTN